MRVYIVCKLDEMTGYIIGLDPYDSVDRAINRAKVIIQDAADYTNFKDEVRMSDFEEDAKLYLHSGLNYEDEYGFVRILVKDM